MKRKKLKLFVWTDFAPDYTSGLAIAIATTEDEARKLIIKNRYSPTDWGTLTVHPLTKKIAFSVGGGG